jgi:hypothetical protein
LHALSKGTNGAHIIDLYASPDYSDDKLIEPLPSWFRCKLWGDVPSYAILEDAIVDLNDWEALAEVKRYRKYDEEHKYIMQKLQLLKADLQSIEGARQLCKERLVTAQIAGKVKHLKFSRNIEPMARRSGWREGGKGKI